MKKVLCMAAVAALVAVSSVSAQTVLTIGLEANGPTGYLVTGELSAGSEGLALWGVDVNSDVSGIAALTPGAGMTSFVKNDGLTNPAGYGGTASGDYDLLQVGGGQNTINNNSGNAPYPIGTVVTGIANTKITLAEGACVANETITLANGFANVIDLGEGGPVFAVSAADIVLGAPLTCGGGGVDLTAAVSRFVHGSAGTFDIDILAGDVSEGRRNAGGVFTFEIGFDGPITEAGDATVSDGTVTNQTIVGNAMIVEVTGAADRQCLTIDMSTAINETIGNDPVVQVALHQCDSNGDHYSNSTDIVNAKNASSGAPVTGANFQFDTNADGFANSTDIVNAKNLSSGVGTFCP